MMKAPGVYDYTLFYSEEDADTRVVGCGIAVYPSDLRKGLERILADNGIENIEVDRYSGMSRADIETYLKQGFPVIASVDGGNHWVAITFITFCSIRPSTWMK